jgi:hypothetical protein
VPRDCLAVQLRVSPRHTDRGEGALWGRRRWHRATASTLVVAWIATSVAASAYGQAGADSSRGHAPADTRSRSRDTTPTGGAAFAGRVTDSAGTPVAQAVVVLVGTADTAVTNDDGSFVVRNLTPGAYLVSVGRIGFRPERFATTVVAGQTRDAQVSMTRFVPLLATVTTTAHERAAYRAVGFDQRMRVGNGQFLTYDQIVRKQATTFTQLLEGMRGVWVTENPRQSGAPVGGTRGVGSCTAYVVDGVPQSQFVEHDAANHPIGVESPDNLIDPSQVGAIEVYSASERPGGLGGGQEHPVPPPGAPPPAVGFDRQQCGLVVVWTRAKLGLVGQPAAGAAAGALATGTLTPAMTSGGATQGRAVFVPDAECRPVPPIDTTDLLVYANVEGARPRRMSNTSWAEYKARVLAALGRWSALPSELVLPSIGLPFANAVGPNSRARGRHPDLDVTPTLSAVLLFTLDPTGALGSSRVVATSLSPNADTSMLAMVERAASAHDLPPLPAIASGEDSVRLYLVVESVAPTSVQRGAVLGQMEVPVWRLARPARLASGPQPTDAGRVGGDSSHADSVTVKMVVDAIGHPVRRTAQLEVSPMSAGRPPVESEDRLLALLPQFQFEPALIGTCRMPQLVVQTFAAPETSAGH